MLYQNIMCWWNVFQCSTFLCEQLLTSVVHRPTDACLVIYRIAQQNAQLQQDSFRTVQLNVNTLLRMHLSPEENYSMFPQGHSDGGYIGIYTPKISNRFVHVCDINICFEIAMTIVKTYTPKSNSWLRPCVSQADFLNCPAKADVVSHPAKAWKTA